MENYFKALSLFILPFILISCGPKLTNFNDKANWGPIKWRRSY